MNVRGRRRAQFSAALLSTIWFALSLIGSAHAQDATWTGPGNEWTTGTNWNPGQPSGIATFTNNGAPTSVTISNTTSINTLNFTAAAPAYSFTIGNAATFTINDPGGNGTTNASAFSPAFTVNTGATLALADGVSAEIGALAGGGSVALGGSMDTGTFLSIAGGTSTTFSGSFSGAGTLELNTTGTTLTLTGASNGGNIGTIGGTLDLCSCFAGGVTISGGSLTVGVDSPFGGVQVEGGTLSVINGGRLQIGSLSNPAALGVSSNMLISGPGSSVTVTGGPTSIGFSGPATLSISNGGVLNSLGGAEIDSFGPGTPSVTVTGPGSTWNVGGGFFPGLFVGDGGVGDGPGLLTIANGGAVNVNGFLFLGDSVDGSSAVSVTGAGSALTVQGGLAVGGFCGCGGTLVGTLTVADGAVVNSPGGTGIFFGSTLNLGTGGLSGAIVTPFIANDGQIVANFTDTLTLAADIAGAGSLSKLGAGTLILTGTNSYTGGTTINGGTLQLGNGGTTGTIAGNVTNNGTLAFNWSNAQTFAGVISGSGAVQQLGAGKKTLTANIT
jgi:fibronectin-binding autotransporter adhesin